MVLEVFVPLAGMFLPPLLALLVFLYKQNVKLAVIEARSAELNHNGGSSLKDIAKGALNESVKAAALARESLDRQIASEAEKRVMLGQIQADVASVRTSQALMDAHIDRIDQDRLLKEKEWSRLLGQQGIDTPGFEGSVT